MLGLVMDAADSAGEDGAITPAGGDGTSVGEAKRFGEILKDAENCAGESLGDRIE